MPDQGVLAILGAGAGTVLALGCWLILEWLSERIVATIYVDTSGSMCTPSGKRAIDAALKGIANRYFRIGKVRLKTFDDRLYDGGVRWIAHLNGASILYGEGGTNIQNVLDDLGSSNTKKTYIVTDGVFDARFFVEGPRVEIVLVQG